VYICMYVCIIIEYKKNTKEDITGPPLSGLFKPLSNVSARSLDVSPNQGMNAMHRIKSIHNNMMVSQRRKRRVLCIIIEYMKNTKESIPLSSPPSSNVSPTQGRNKS
jgi:hypothetical protein